MRNLKCISSRGCETGNRQKDKPEKAEKNDIRRMLGQMYDKVANGLTDFTDKIGLHFETFEKYRAALLNDPKFYKFISVFPIDGQDKCIKLLQASFNNSKNFLLFFNSYLGFADCKYSFFGNMLEHMKDLVMTYGSIENVVSKMNRISKIGLAHEDCLDILNRNLEPDFNQLKLFLKKLRPLGITDGIVGICELDISLDRIIDVIKELRKLDYKSSDIRSFFQDNDDVERSLLLCKAVTIPLRKAKFSNLDIFNIIFSTDYKGEDPTEIIRFFVAVKNYTDCTDCDSIAKAYNLTSSSKVKREFLIYIFSTGRTDVDCIDRTVDVFFEDPALDHCEAVYTKIQNPGMALMLGRNLYLSGVKLSKVCNMDQDEMNFQIDRINGLRSEYANVEIFKDRNVAIVAHGEIWRYAPKPWLEGKKRFAYPEFLKDLKLSIGKNDLQVYGPRDGLKVENEEQERKIFEKIKADSLFAIEHTDPPLTFIFDGHGGPNGLFLKGGEVENLFKDFSKYPYFYFTPTEIAGAISKRKNNFPDKDLSRDIYIFDSCFNHTFLRSVSLIIREKNGVQPIFMGPSEYGQLGMSALDPKRKNAPFYKILNLGKNSSTIGNAVKNEKKYKDSDFTIYVPYENNIQQIVRSEYGPNQSRG